MKKRTEKILKEITNNSIRKDIIESELFKLLRYRKMLDPDRNSSIVIGRIPKAFKDEGYKVLGCNFDDVLDTWITVVDMSDKFPEEWRPVRGYEGLYEVSNWGRVRSLKFSKIRIMSLSTKNKKGYINLLLRKNGKGKMFFVHRLVYEAFHGPVPEGLYVNHIDENKTNNRLDNLNLMTCRENNDYGTRNKRISEKLTNGKSSKPVLQFTLNGEFVREWPSISECGRNGFNLQAVSLCCLGKHKKHKNYKWAYKNE